MVIMGKLYDNHVLNYILKGDYENDEEIFSSYFRSSNRS